MQYCSYNCEFNTNSTANNLCPNDNYNDVKVLYIAIAYAVMTVCCCFFAQRSLFQLIYKYLNCSKFFILSSIAFAGDTPLAAADVEASTWDVCGEVLVLLQM